MLSMRRPLLALACALAALVFGSQLATAQSWPQRPVKFILTLGGGSGTDIGMRMVADRLSKIWGHPVVIENKPGGDAIVAITSFLSANDDHVFLASPSSAFVHHPYVQQNLPYKLADLVPIARGWNVLIVIAVPAALPVNSLKELVAMAKAQPGKLNWAGTTGAIDFTFAGFLKKNSLEMARVPYRNPQDAANDLATGRIEVAEASLATLRPQLQAGKIKLLATTASTRDPAYPDVPTVKEAGFPQLTLDGLVGLFGMPSTPSELRERIAADFKKAADDPTIKERLTATGQTLNLGGPAEFTKAIDEQRATVAAAAKDQGIAASQ